MDYRRANGQKPPASKPSLAYRQPSPSYDPYYDPYYASDSSSQCRSGSTTPVQIDSETRERMDTMERHGFIFSCPLSPNFQEMNPTAQKEMMQLRKQIMNLQQPSNGFGGQSPLLNTIYNETRNTQAELKQLKRLAQVNALASQDLLNEALIKKLAMVQDPALKLHYNKKGDSTNKRLITKLTGIATAIHNNNTETVSPSSLSNLQ
uniref:Uncharacterized protein n=1 Tax=Ditylenchus dipsaci TaxID=166011 RepID=A0A915EFR6_9BILA